VIRGIITISIDKDEVSEVDLGWQATYADTSNGKAEMGKAGKLNLAFVLSRIVSLNFLNSLPECQVSRSQALSLGHFRSLLVRLSTMEMG
jgi:hypothetical protein